MDFTLSPGQIAWRDRVRAFMRDHVYRAEDAYHAHARQEGAARWQIPPVIEELKARAYQEGLWNLFLPPSEQDTEDFRGAGLSNLEYALCAEEMGRVSFASEAFNCSAPDTGNMEVLHRYGTPDQRARWLRPLMDGAIRSAFLMTEPDVASSDATNIQTSIRREGDEYVINGRKWWSSGVGDPRCALAIVMGKTDPEAERHRQQSQVLVPLDTPGVEIVRLLPVLGFDGAPHGHGEVVLRNVRVPVDNMILGEGRGFEIAQGRLGPGRIHHCMRAIGAAERAIDKMSERLQARIAFGKRLSDRSVWEQRLGEARLDIEMTRLLCLKAADMMDRTDNKAARLEIAMIKVAAPRTALRVVDHAIQAHGAGGLSDDFGLAEVYAGMRALRIADGPDEVHLRSIARMELGRAKDRLADWRHTGSRSL
ncbi:acyl-CoA dehydrogenase family protein [Qipengyuania sp. YG27]|uniref:Acyl-CoA dehydrogenase family protein n=1 Tax=Qipengyuania mesophila TaxID=2867246 RepID=A0ABS7JT84_9SPHN|nr:acyl-CoA dehydrogenase family protein [Qipengyuania mesophila]MBX7500857.1 acyl-CoA dehydrogenase family protein [Qipengyuania mesophila]